MDGAIRAGLSVFARHEACTMIRPLVPGRQTCDKAVKQIAVPGEALRCCKSAILSSAMQVTACPGGVSG